jgi:hypothetical protein
LALFKIQLAHKEQTKLNDCWYASIQMLKTWKNWGTKVKPSGAHTKHLHAGLFGHKLNADSGKSKHFEKVLTENNIICLPRTVLRLQEPESLLDALQTYGPIMSGGTFGKAMRGLIKNLGHYVVLAGVDTISGYYMLHDPWEAIGPKWMKGTEFCQMAWNDNESNFANDAPKVVNF